MMDSEAGDRMRPEDFERQLVDHMDTMYAAALRLTRNPADAKDLLQDALVRALRFHDKFREGTYIKAWLLTILRNTFINDYRKRSRRPLEVELTGAAQMPESQPDRDLGYFPESLKDDNVLELLGEETRLAVESLPETHRRAVIMADLQDMSYKEIAEALNCPLGTVMSRLHRGRRLLRAALPAETREMAVS